jgi:hypothetical protein
MQDEESSSEHSEDGFSDGGRVDEEGGSNDESPSGSDEDEDNESGVPSYQGASINGGSGGMYYGSGSASMDSTGVSVARAHSASFDTTQHGSGLASGKSTPAKPTGRPVSFIWPIFTSEFMPWKLKKGPCNFCKEVVLYHKKSEYVLSHLKKCQPFLKHCKE